MADAKSSYDIFTKWLHRIHARETYEFKEKNCTITQYAVNGKTFMVLTMYERKELQGWFIYVPASDTNKTADEIDAAAIRLGVEGCAGLIPEPQFVDRSGSNFTLRQVSEIVQRATGSAANVAEIRVGGIYSNGGIWFQRIE